MIPDPALFNSIRELLKADRSVRRFQADKPIPHSTLLDLIDLTRFCASSQNMQPLRYVIVDDAPTKDILFPLLRWARHLKDWDGPTPEERPSAYLVQLTDTTIAPSLLCDCGLQLQAITLGATSLGINGCIIRNFNPAEVHQALKLDSRYKVEYVLALGYASEKIKMTSLAENEDSGYYRLPDGTHVVPKRTLDQLIIDLNPQRQ